MQLAEAHPGVVGIQLVDQSLAPLDERAIATKAPFELIPVGRVQILDDIDARRRHAWIKIRERGLDVRHDMTAVVEYHVRWSELGQDAVQEVGIGLAPNPHGNLVLLEVPARLNNVDPHDLCERSDMPLP